MIFSPDVDKLFSDFNFFFQKFSKPSNSSKNLKFEILPYKMNQNTCKIFKNKIFKRELKIARFVKNLKSKFISYKMGDNP